MLVGHIAAGLIAKRTAPRVSLGTLVLACIAADLLWCVFLAGGIERVQILPGHSTQDSLVAIDIRFSHSFLMDAVWGLLFAAIFFARRRYTQGACVLFAGVVSHWFLDFVSHRPDMPLAPQLNAALGLGLWDSVGATVALEGGFWLIAVLLYARATHRRGMPVCTDSGAASFYSRLPGGTTSRARRLRRMASHWRFPASCSSPS